MRFFAPWGLRMTIQDWSYCMYEDDKRLGVYIHIPFCASKCGYCDFCSLAGKDKLMNYYQDALLIQIQETAPRLKQYLFDTVYFGGGTPSYYGAKRIVEILDELKYTNQLLRSSEITMECNPDSVRSKDLRMLRKAGVNRLSMGAQSANDELLKLIGRRHTWHQVEMAFRRARKAGFKNISIDLIYGLPYQTREDWADTLTRTIALKPAHISCYGLRLEEGTAMYEEFEGSDAIPSEDDQADMYLFAVDLLERHGYKQYEISNFARKGYESRHNLKYWRLEDYIGFGAAAHSNLGSLRYSYTRNVRQYISGVLGEKNIIDEQEELNAFNRAAEYLMLGMRTSRGICREEYTAIYNSSFDALEEMLDVFVANGWAVKGTTKNGTERWRFTPSGYLVSNVLIGVLLEAQTKEKFNANPW
ncbi:MAG: radical SAM family heme chaperone HemW, partial [Ruminococcaceae bacterium]|nr:radical SAM family heme chaperone HemW [Oscillospiraceae bacterium]